MLTEKGKDEYRNESYDLWRDENMINIKEKKVMIYEEMKTW